MRLRIGFAKNDLMRFTGHLDLHRSWERIFRRAGLPLAYTQGFSPHPRINLASALPLGFTSEAELVDVWLEAELPLDEIARTLTARYPTRHPDQGNPERVRTLTQPAKQHEIERVRGHFPG